MPKKKRRKVISRKKYKEKRSARYPHARFSVGDLVQVNDDIMDFDWGDLPIGGWVGKITKVHRKEEGPQYDVQWTEETLSKSHPIYEMLAALEDLKINQYESLTEQALHAFAGGEVLLINPDEAVVLRYTDRPLDPKDQTDRLRIIFDSKPLEWFPVLEDDEAENARLLKRYYDHLLEHLVFPFEATYVKKHDKSLQSSLYAFTAEKLIDPDAVRRMENADDSESLYCSGTDADGTLLEVPLQHVISHAQPQQQLLDDYASWIGDLYMMMKVYEKRDWLL